LCGDAGKAQRVLGWQPEVDFKQLIEMMVDAEMKALATSGFYATEVISGLKA
jgi:GDPmannose 4,6-dehydratase